MPKRIIIVKYDMTLYDGFPAISSEISQEGQSRIPPGTPSRISLEIPSEISPRIAFEILPQVPGFRLELVMRFLQEFLPGNSFCFFHELRDTSRNAFP